MVLNVPYNWSKGLLEKLEPYKEYISELYAGIPSSIVGNLRHPRQLPDMDLARARSHIEAVHSLGVDFNFIANSLCMGNQEYTRKPELHDYFSRIVDAGTDRVVVGNPFVVEFVKKHLPNLKIKLSLSALVDSTYKMSHYYDKVEVISVPDILNRDIVTLKEIIAKANDVELLLNNMCLYDCPLITYHGAFASHNSQAGATMTRHNFPMAWCTRQKLDNPVELLRSPWIRPEDIARYEALGVNRFKIAGREYSTEWIEQRVRIYTQRSHEGNSLDFLNVLLYGVRDGKLPEGLDIVINNKPLDGFIDHFMNGQCKGSCDNCGYCEEYWAKAGAIHGDLAAYRRMVDRSIDKMLEVA